MFEIGFGEIALILVIALLVVGPEKLPGVARTLGLWLGKMRRFVASVKADIDRELQTEELKRLVDKQAQDMAQLRSMLNETKAAIDSEQFRAMPSPAAIAPGPGTGQDPDILAPSSESAGPTPDPHPPQADP